MQHHTSVLSFSSHITVLLWYIHVCKANTASDRAVYGCVLVQPVLWDPHQVAMQAAKFNHVNIMHYIRSVLSHRDVNLNIDHVFNVRVSCSAARNGSLDVLM
jgi:hypothetical protein